MNQRKQLIIEINKLTQWAFENSESIALEQFTFQDLICMRNAIIKSNETIDDEVHRWYL